MEHTTRPKNPFVVMAKPIGSLCNLRCSYCYYLEAGLRNGQLQQYRMSDEMLERYISEYIASNPGPTIQFTWHGGEPTLAGLDFYKKAVELQKKYLPAGWECWNNLQTNGLLLDDEWCEFLKKNRFDIGLSIDGSSAVHDTFRKHPDGRGSYDETVAAVKRLQAHGIQPDLLCTVTSASAKDPLAVYRGLRNLGTGWIQFIPIVCFDDDGNVTLDSITPEGYGKFLCDIFDEWLYHDLGKLDVQLFAEMALVWSGGQASLCWMAPTCGRVLIVEHDGGVYSCDHFVDPDHRIGTLGENTLEELVDLPRQQAFGQSKRDALPTRCKECPWLDLCGGGCLKDRFLTDEHGDEGLYYLCDGLRELFAHAEKPMKRVMALSRQRLSPDAIMQMLRTEALEKWKGVGRNDPCPCGSGKKAKHCCWNRKP